MRQVILFIAQGGFAGRVPVAPGTIGTLVGLLIYLALMRLPPAVYALLCAVLLIIGILIAGRAETILQRTDDPSIVIDEIAGYLVAMFLVPVSWAYAAAGFLLFRLFDIVKPWPLRRLQALHGGAGIMLDDLGAAFYTNIILQTFVFALAR